MKLNLRVGARRTFASLSIVAGAMTIVLASPVSADVDTDFASRLHIYGIYGQRDYNAWIGKIVCKRMRTGLDADAYEAASFLKNNLPRDLDAQQVYQYLGAAIRFYCPDQQPMLDALAGQSPPIEARTSR